MARIRSIKPEFPQSETIGSLSRDARLLFIQLWTFVDDEGRARAASRMLASLLYPYDDDAPHLIEGWLSELEAADCLVRYVIDGSMYVQINNWLKHQKIDRPTPSRIPEFDEASRALARNRCSTLDLGPRILDLGSKKESSPSAPASDIEAASVEAHAEAIVTAAIATIDRSPADTAAPKPGLDDEFERWWKHYPNKTGKKPARLEWGRAIKKIPPDQLLAQLRAYRFAANPKFIPAPVRWLSRELWNDETHPGDVDRRAAPPSRMGYLLEEMGLKGDLVS